MEKLEVSSADAAAFAGRIRMRSRDDRAVGSKRLDLCPQSHRAAGERYFSKSLRPRHAGEGMDGLAATVRCSKSVDPSVRSYDQRRKDAGTSRSRVPARAARAAGFAKSRGTAAAGSGTGS